MADSKLVQALRPELRATGDPEREKAFQSPG